MVTTTDVPRHPPVSPGGRITLCSREPIALCFPRKLWGLAICSGKQWTLPGLLL